MAVKRWALLCGSDYYVNGTARSKDGKLRTIPNLSGCVQDVKDTYDALVKLGLDPKHIRLLKASLPGQRPAGENGDRPTEDESLWPTRENIERELDWIAEKAGQGDLVYFHYSGHGVQRQRLELLPGEMDDGSILDGMALVMTDVLLGGRYLTGYSLGNLVRKMVEAKGLRVTMVLDSCHSGSGWRADVPEGLTPRTILDGQLDGTWMDRDEEAVESVIFANSDTEVAPNPRDTVLGRKPSWLSQPKNCTVLTACSAGQVAGERVFGNSNFKQGILTHWVVKILGRFVDQRLPSHAYILDHVKYGILSMGSRVAQTPLLFGEGLCEFFGKFAYFERTASYVLGRRGKTIELDVGAAQGVAPGALYDLVQNNESFSPGPETPSLQACVTEVREFTSTAELQTKREDVGLGWLAFLRRWAFDPPRRIKFLADQEGMQNKLDAELQKTRGFVLTKDPKAESDITVQIGPDDIYEIFQHGRRLSRLPQIAVGEELAAEKLAQVVNHVSRFQALRELFLKPASQYLREADFSFNVQPDEVKEKDRITASLTYKGQVYERVWCSLFCFTASWGIVKLDPMLESGQVANEARRGRPLEEFETDMMIPPKGRPDDPCDIGDVFTVFASGGDQPVSWGDICLPPLPIDSLSLSPLVEIKRPVIEDELDIQNSERSTIEPYRDPDTTSRAKGTKPAITRWTVLERVVRTFPR